MLSSDAEWRVLDADDRWRQRVTVWILAFAAYGLLVLVFREGWSLEALLGKAAALKSYGPALGRPRLGWQVHVTGTRAVSAGLRYLLVAGALLLVVRGGGPMAPVWQAARLVGIALGVLGAVAVAFWLGV